MGQRHGSAVFFEGLGLDRSRLEAAVRKSLDVDALDLEPDLELFEHKRCGVSALVCVQSSGCFVSAFGSPTSATRPSKRPCASVSWSAFPN